MSSGERDGLICIKLDVTRAQKQVVDCGDRPSDGSMKMPCSSVELHHHLGDHYEDIRQIYFRFMHWIVLPHFVVL